MGKRELVALLNLSSWCLVMVERLFLAVPQGCLQFVIVVFPDHTHYYWDIKNSRLGHDLPTSVNERVNAPFREGFIFEQLRIHEVL